MSLRTADCTGPEMTGRCSVDHGHLVSGEIDRRLRKAFKPPTWSLSECVRKTRVTRAGSSPSFPKPLSSASAHHTRVERHKLVARFQDVHRDKAEAHDVETVNNLTGGRNWVSHTI